MKILILLLMFSSLCFAASPEGQVFHYGGSDIPAVDMIFQSDGTIKMIAYEFEGKKVYDPKYKWSYNAEKNELTISYINEPSEKEKEFLKAMKERDGQEATHKFTDVERGIHIYDFSKSFFFNGVRYDKKTPQMEKYLIEKEKRNAQIRKERKQLRAKLNKYIVLGLNKKTFELYFTQKEKYSVQEKELNWMTNIALKDESLCSVKSCISLGKSVHIYELKKYLLVLNIDLNNDVIKEILYLPRSDMDLYKCFGTNSKEFFGLCSDETCKEGSSLWHFNSTTKKVEAYKPFQIEMCLRNKDLG